MKAIRSPGCTPSASSQCANFAAPAESASKLKISSAPSRMRDPHGSAAIALGMAGDAFMRDIEMFAVTIEQLPQAIHIGMGLRVGIAGEVCESCHRLAYGRKTLPL